VRQWFWGYHDFLTEGRLRELVGEGGEGSFGFISLDYVHIDGTRNKIEADFGYIIIVGK
jgi:hypothetical protein